MDEVKKTSLAHINEIQMTYKEHCHTTDTYLQIFYYAAQSFALPPHYSALLCGPPP